MRGRRAQRPHQGGRRDPAGRPGPRPGTPRSGRDSTRDSRDGEARPSLTRRFQGFASDHPLPCGVALIGSLCLTAALLFAFRGPSYETRAVAREVAAHAEKLRGLDEQLAGLEGDVATYSARLDRMRSENDVLEEVVIGHWKKLDEVKRGGTRVKKAQREVEILLAREEKERRRHEQLLRRLERQTTGGGFREYLEVYKKMVVTVTSGGAHWGTGFFYNPGGPGAFVITSSRAIPQDDNVEVKFQFLALVSGEAVMAATVLYRDDETGLAFLAPRLGPFAPYVAVYNFTPDMLTLEVGEGEEVFSIGTVSEGTFLERSVFDGIVSSPPRDGEGGGSMKVTIPVNPGTVGSPIVNGEGRFVGVLGGAGSSAAGAISARELRSAVERFRDEMERRNSGRESGR